MPEDDIQRSITAFWSGVAREYEAHPGNVPRRESAEFDAWVTAIARMLPPAPADVLDIGCGTGFVSLIAARLGHRVTGIDLAESMLDEARAQAARLGLNARFVIRDGVEPAFDAESFDAIICRHFLWTLRTPEVAFRAWHTLLRPTGRVVAIDGYWFRDPPPRDDEAAAEEPGIFERHYTEDVRSSLPVMGYTSPGPVVEMFERSGFVDVTVGDLADVHALAEDPPGDDPWYSIIAGKP